MKKGIEILEKVWNILRIPFIGGIANIIDCLFKVLIMLIVLGFAFKANILTEKEQVYAVILGFIWAIRPLIVNINSIIKTIIWNEKEKNYQENNGKD